MELIGRTSNGLHEFSHEQLDSLRRISNSSGDGRAVMNSFNQPTAVTASNLLPGIQFFDFDTVGRQVFLDITPLVNRIPRVGPVGGTAIAWREITDINVNKTLPGVSEGKRGGLIDRATRDKLVTFSGLGIENANTYESVYAARGVANPRELARLDALKALRMAEERIALYANRSVTLSTPAAPSGVAAAPGAGESSTMTARTIVCQVVALTGEGVYLSSVASGVATSITRNNADGTTDIFGGGSTPAGVASSGVVVGAGNKVTWSVASVRGALGYAWFTGLSAGTKRLAGITTINRFVQFADEGGAAQDAATITSNNSKNALEFDGLMNIATDPLSGGYYKDMNSTALTADGSGNIKEFVEAFYYFFTNYLFSPNELLVHPLEAYNITKILLAGPAAAIYSSLLKANDNVQGGFYVSKILNPFTGQAVSITVHPYQSAGHIGLVTYTIPYPIEKLGNIWEFAQRQPYYAIEWPARTRKDEVGVYVDEVLKCELSFAQGAICNVLSIL